MPKTMTIYDFDDKPTRIELPDKAISAICVSVISGDETGEVLFEDGSTIPFDASNCRLMDFYDGSYSVRGRLIDRWLNFTPAESRTASYDRQDAVAAWEEETDNAT